MPASRTPTIAVGLLNAGLDFARERGASTDPIVRRAGIDPAALDDPDVLVDWARSAFGAALRADKAKRKPKRHRR